MYSFALVNVLFGNVVCFFIVGCFSKILAIILVGLDACLWKFWCWNVWRSIFFLFRSFRVRLSWMLICMAFWIAISVDLLGYFLLINISFLSFELWYLVWEFHTAVHIQFCGLNRIFMYFGWHVLKERYCRDCVQFKK